MFFFLRRLVGRVFGGWDTEYCGCRQRERFDSETGDRTITLEPCHRHSDEILAELRRDARKRADDCWDDD